MDQNNGSSAVNSVANIAKALAAAQSEMSGATKDGFNPHFKTKYADLASVTRAIREPLTKNGIAWSQAPSSSADLGAVTVVTRLMHISGECLESTITMPVAQRTPQAFGSALTYARRYALSAMVGLEAEDDDGQSASSRGAQVADKINARPSPAPMAVSVKPAEPSPYELILAACESAGMAAAAVPEYAKTITGKKTRAQLATEDVDKVLAALASKGGGL